MAYNYPYGNGQQLNLDWFLNEWKNLLAAWEAEKNGIDGALQAEIDRAEAALADVFAARDAAAQSAANALESKNAAAQSASDASGYLATVRTDANAAHNAAQNAAQSESNAAESAQTALASKNTAANSERNAAQSEANALTSKNAAAQSAEDALANKNAAAQSAEDALTNKNAAAQSAEDAEDAAASVEASAQQITTNTRDISNLKESINNKAPIIVNNASGKIAHFKDGADNIPVKALTIEGAESATVTRTGKNLLDPSARTTAATNIKYYTSTGLQLVAGTYALSISETVQGMYVIDKDTENTISQKYNSTFLVFTLTEDTSVIFDFFSSAGISANALCQLEIGASATTYEPYKSNTFLYPSESVTTFYGVNNIWSENGIVNVTYCTDTKLYIDNKIAELQATTLENIGG